MRVLFCEYRGSNKKVLRDVLKYFKLEKYFNFPMIKETCYQPDTLVFSKSFAHNHLGNCFKNPCISLKIETVTLFVRFFIEPPNSSNCAFDLVTSDMSG